MHIEYVGVIGYQKENFVGLKMSNKWAVSQLVWAQITSFMSAIRNLVTTKQYILAIIANKFSKKLF